MFSNCESLSELNMARVKAASEGVPLVEVNNAYNKRRLEIVNATSHFTKISTVPVEVVKPDSLCATLAYLGPSEKPGSIVITAKGIYA